MTELNKSEKRELVLTAADGTGMELIEHINRLVTQREAAAVAGAIEAAAKATDAEHFGWPFKESTPEQRQRISYILARACAATRALTPADAQAAFQSAVTERARDASSQTVQQFVDAVQNIHPLPKNQWTQTWPPDEILAQVIQSAVRESAKGLREALAFALSCLRCKERWTALDDETTVAILAAFDAQFPPAEDAQLAAALHSLLTSTLEPEQPTDADIEPPAQGASDEAK